MKVLSQLLVVCLLAALHAEGNVQPEETGEDERHLGRRYAELAVGSEISKIVDSLVQKNFVDFLLNHREKKSKPAAAAQEDPEKRLYEQLLEFSHEKQKTHV